MLHIASLNFCLNSCHLHFSSWVLRPNYPGPWTLRVKASADLIQIVGGLHFHPLDDFV